MFVVRVVAAIAVLVAVIVALVAAINCKCTVRRAMLAEASARLRGGGSVEFGVSEVGEV